MIKRRPTHATILGLGLLGSGLACGLTTGDVRRISAAELQAALAADAVLIVDVRTREAYDAVHIVGAISLPLEEVARAASELPRDKLIATYCT